MKSPRENVTENGNEILGNNKLQQKISRPEVAQRNEDPILCDINTDLFGVGQAEASSRGRNLVPFREVWALPKRRS